MKLTRIFGIVLGLHVGVILLVMMQPGCQSTKQGQISDLNDSATVEKDPLDSFNQGTTEDKPAPAKPAAEFVSPTRPKAGELIIPGQVDPIIPADNVNNPIATGPTNLPLVPTDLNIYKIQRGDTLWGIARKNQLSTQELLSANPNLSKDSRLNIGQEIMIPSAGATVKATQEIIPPSVEGGVTYIVRPGDSLSKIARSQGVSLALLMQANRMNASSIIRPGQSLVIPEQKNSSTVTITPVAPVPDGAITHTVKKGENLTRISAIYGVTVKDIMRWNNLADAGRIRIGQALIVSDSSGSGTDTPVPSPIVETDAPIEEALPPSENDSLENFFKGNVEERPVIEVPDN
jgi:LysM repeat protein